MFYVLPFVSGDLPHSVLEFADRRIWKHQLESVPQSGEEEEELWRRIKSKSSLTWPGPLAFPYLQVAENKHVLA